MRTTLLALSALACTPAATSGATAADLDGEWKEKACEWEDGGWTVPSVTEPVPVVAWVSDGDSWRVADLVSVRDALGVRYTADDDYTADCVVFVAR